MKELSKDADDSKGMCWPTDKLHDKKITLGWIVIICFRNPLKAHSCGNDECQSDCLTKNRISHETEINFVNSCL
jgi:hypothetical protein